MPTTPQLIAQSLRFMTQPPGLTRRTVLSMAAVATVAARFGRSVAAQEATPTTSSTPTTTSATVHVNGIDLYYEETGSGPALLNIPPLSSTGFTIPALEPHFRFITFDNRGAGRSSAPPGPYTTRQMADDKSGATLSERIKAAGHFVIDRTIVPDDIAAIRGRVKEWIESPAIDVVITTGGTGFTGRDVTPEAVEPLFEKKMDAFAALFLMVSFRKIGTSAIQSRATAGLANSTYIFCLPGSPGACRDAWDEILVHQLDYRYRPCNFVEIMPRLDEHLRRGKAKGAAG
jgi:molybdenum cofactor biosynthesis protein B